MNQEIKVLLVDDEDQFRSVTKKILNKKGFETILAGCCEEAIDKLKEKPDVVILDIKMPGVDGHQTLREIKERYPDLPVIMLSGHGVMPSARESFVEGAFDYLTKPCDIDILTTKIIDACSRGKDERHMEEKRVMDIMVPIQDYTALSMESTVREAIDKLKESFSSKILTGKIMGREHHFLLALDDRGKVSGVLSITDLLKAVIPAYIRSSGAAVTDSIRYSSMFWAGMFSREVKQLSEKKIKEIMSPAPVTIEGGANLIEAAYMMLKNKEHLLVVVTLGKVEGVIREQDLFIEM
ncbi:MAG: response regulator [Candidatus Desulfaltia sp.]|nr:response regulator [Candidatus Desulfaltia sp.]